MPQAILLAITIACACFNWHLHSQKNEKIKSLEIELSDANKGWNQKHDAAVHWHEQYHDLEKRATRFRKGISHAIFDQDFSYTHDAQTGKCKLYQNLRYAPMHILRLMDDLNADPKDHALYTDGDDGC